MTAGAYAFDTLTYGEAWNFIRDVLLLILDRDFGGQEEPLALLVAPAICRALLALVRHASPQASTFLSGCSLTHDLTHFNLDCKGGITCHLLERYQWQRDCNSSRPKKDRVVGSIVAYWAISSRRTRTPSCVRCVGYIDC